MRAYDPRRSATEEVILGLLAGNYRLGGITTIELLGLIEKLNLPAEAKRGLGLRNVKRYLYEFAEKGWVEHWSLPNLARYRITVEGYHHYYRDIEGKDTSSLSIVPVQLMPPLMVKKIWRLTDDQARYLTEYSSNRKSLLVLLPTGAGKTLIAMLESYRNHVDSLGSTKTLYMSPFKAINSQTLAEFISNLSPLGLNIARQDGDYHTTEGGLAKANVVISTFESAQIALHRRETWLQNVGLVIIDELTSIDSTSDRLSDQEVLSVRTSNRPGEVLHFTKPPRGANLDLLVVCLLDFFRGLGTDVRFVCLGIPNSNERDLQRWLGKDTAILNASHIPQRYEEKVAIFQKTADGKMSWQIQRKDESVWEGPFEFERPESTRPILSVVLHCLDRISKLPIGNRRPILVFVHGRKSTTGLATLLRDQIRSNELSEPMSTGRGGNAGKIMGSAIIPTTTVRQLTEVVASGIGFHHAGLFPAQRRLIEEMMNDGSLSVLFSTPTLTHGVDFPIGAVIVDHLLLNFFQYSRLEYVQLRGRVNHKDPFDHSAAMADVISVSENDKGEGSTEKVRDLLNKRDPPIESLSLNPGNLEMLVFRAIQYLSSRSQGMKAEDLVQLVRSTYEYGRRVGGTGGAKKFDRQISEVAARVLKLCATKNMIILDKGIFVLGGLGKGANEVGLSFYDLTLVIVSLQNILRAPKDQRERLLIAASVRLVDSRDQVREVLPRKFMYEDVPRKLRTGSQQENSEIQTLRSNTIFGIMSRWMNEEPVSRVIINEPRFQIYENGLLASARTIARILRSIANTAELLAGQLGGSLDEAGLLDTAKLAKVLSTRIRFGIKEDIADSELGRIASKAQIEDLINSQGYPEFIVRIVLRLLARKRVLDAKSLVQFQGRKAVTLRDLRGYDLDKETANHVARYHRAKVDLVASRIIAEAAVGL